MSTQAPEQLEKPTLNRLAVCEYQLRMTLEFVQMADRKARFLMRIGLGLFGATFIGLPPTIGVLKGYLDQGGSGLAAFSAVVAMYAICIGCLTVAMMKMISVVRPRILNHEQAAPSPFFFQSIAHMPMDQYKAMMENLEPDDAVDELTTMIYHNSVVADAKFRKLDQAIRWLLGGGLFGFVFALLVIVSVRMF
ncbi:MAG: Pycsar system effector family protein [Phycisphaeraceae bacterium]